MRRSCGRRSASSSMSFARRGRSPTSTTALQREVAEREKAQQALQLANQELERRVHERTAALTRAHQGVRENEERLRMALEVAQIAAWEWHLASGQMRWSTDPEVLFGFPKGSFGQELRIVRAVHDQDRPRVEAATAAALETGTYETEYRAVRPDGQRRVDYGARPGVCGRRRRPDGRDQPGRDGGARVGPGARAPPEERARGPRRSRTTEPAQRRIPRDPQPRAADADERHSGMARYPDERQGRSATRDPPWRSSSATPRFRPS